MPPPTTPPATESLLSTEHHTPASTVGGHSAADHPASATGGELAVDRVSHHYVSGRQQVHVLDDVSFQVPAGTVTCVVGPSGCGKSTLLNLAAGLITPGQGTMMWDGEPIRPGINRDLGMAFQQPGLFPWMTVRRNVAIGLQTRGKRKGEARQIADEFLETVGLTEFRNAYPSQLSGGMAQRVGIARALALRPRLLLLDEPFAAVDAFTRLKLQQEFKSMLKLGRPTVMFVTHDVSEAISVGDTVVVMTDRPASVKAIVPIRPEDRDKASPAYAKRLAGILEQLGVTEEMG